MSEQVSARLSEIYSDYCAWCEEQHREPMSQQALTRTFSEIAELYDGLKMSHRSRRKVLLNMQLRREEAAA